MHEKTRLRNYAIKHNEMFLNIDFKYKHLWRKPYEDPILDI